MQHGWLGKPSHPFYALFMFWRERRRRQCKQAKRPAPSAVKGSGPHLHPKYLHPKSSVAYENTRLNYRERTILPVFVCIYLYLPAP
jgi:hypothetical protein